MISEEDEGPFRVIRWRPGIRGTQRSFQLRTMTKDGRLWFACQDVRKALGWTKRELLRRRSERLEGSTWRTTTAQWEGRGPRLAFISLTALQVVMAGSVTRHNRAFLCWLDGLDDLVRVLPPFVEEAVNDYPGCEADRLSRTVARLLWSAPCLTGQAAGRV